MISSPVYHINNTLTIKLRILYAIYFQEGVEEESTLPPYKEKIVYPDDAYHMVTQLHWEDDIIWNADDVRQQVYFIYWKL